MLEPVSDLKQREALLMQTKFLAKMTDVILLNLGDYFDTVREEAQLLLVSMTERYLPPQISIQEDELALVQILKSNISSGWPNKLNG